MGAGGRRKESGSSSNSAATGAAATPLQTGFRWSRPAVASDRAREGMGEVLQSTMERMGTRRS